MLNSTLTEKNNYYYNNYCGDLILLEMLRSLFNNALAFDNVNWDYLVIQNISIANHIKHCYMVNLFDTRKQLFFLNAKNRCFTHNSLRKNIFT
jgi:hypothetical protein